MAKKLEGKVAIVTGASKGIGASIALHLAAEGAAVVVNYASSKEGAERVVNEIVLKGGKAIAVQANMTVQAEIQRLFEKTKKEFGKLDILINNAGVYEFEPLENITEKHFHKLFDLNVLGLLIASREAIKYFAASGGSIVNISSVASTSPPPHAAVYGATKAAVDSITKTLSRELGPRSIRVNAVNPGMVETEGLHSGGLFSGDLRKQFESETPLGRIGKPEDISPAVVFFASDDAAWITGETLVISGGFH